MMLTTNVIIKDLKFLRRELDKMNYQPSIIHFDGKKYSSSKIKLNNKSNVLFIDCIFCLSEMIFDNKDTFECSSCGEKITNENY